MTSSPSFDNWPGRSQPAAAPSGRTARESTSLSVVRTETRSPATAAQDFVFGASFTPHVRPSTVRDLTYASALLAAAQRMHGQRDLPGLLDAVVAEAATIIPSDGAAIIHSVGIRRQVLQVHIDTRTDDDHASRVIRAATVDNWFLRPGYVPNLTLDPRWIGSYAQSAAVNWRSLMTVPLASPDPHNQIRLSWFSWTPDAFATQTQIVELLRQHADLAINTLAARHDQQQQRPIHQQAGIEPELRQPA